MKRILQLSALLGVFVLAGACTPTYHASVQDLAAVRALAESAQSAAETAGDQGDAAAALAQAQAAADAALQAANAAQASVEAANQRMDRMFEEAQAK